MYFFFQAEDGIRDGHVTGVQTCALPISGCRAIRSAISGSVDASSITMTGWFRPMVASSALRQRRVSASALKTEIGSASCRERVWLARVDGAVRGRAVVEVSGEVSGPMDG